MTRKAWFLGMATAGLLLAAAACGGGDDDDGGSAGDDDRGTDGSSLDSGALPAATAGASSYSLADAPAEGKALPSGGGTSAGPSLGQLDRKIIFTASLALEAEDVQASYLEAGNAARRVGGFVESSNLSFRTTRDGEQEAVATITLRVPAEKYDSVLSELRGLAGTELTREESGSTEVTEEYVDLQSRLRNLQRSEQQYLELLQQARTIADILSVNDRIDGVRAQIEQIQGRLQVLDDLTDLATISVYIEPMPGAVAVAGSDGPPTVGEAFADAWEASLEVAQYLAAAGAVVSVAMIWLAVPAAVAVAGARRLRRRPAPAGAE